MVSWKWLSGYFLCLSLAFVALVLLLCFSGLSWRPWDVLIDWSTARYFFGMMVIASLVNGFLHIRNYIAKRRITT